MQLETNFLGRSGMYWFFGVVEDRQDPLKLDRVRVRCHGYHTDNKQEIPTSNLPWATIEGPVTSAGVSGIGESGGLVEGTWVRGFFADGPDAQEPIITGTLKGIPLDLASSTYGFNDPRIDTSAAPKKISATYASDGSGSMFTNSNAGTFPRTVDEPDTSRLARNDSQFVALQVTNKKAARTASTSSPGGSIFSEPAIPYASIYPYNKVKETESGHALEFDDTPGAERVHLYHRTGSYLELNPDGSSVLRSVQNSYRITHKDAFEHTLGNQTIVVDKGMTINVAKSGSGDYSLVVNSGGNVSITVAGGNVTLNVTGNLTANVSGQASITTPIVNIQAPTGNAEVTITGDLTVTGNTTTGGLAAVGGGTSTGTAAINVPLNVTGGNNVTVSGGDVVAGTVTLLTHVHGGVQGGSGTTGPAVG